MTKDRDDLRRPSPQALAKAIVGQRVEVAGMLSILPELPFDAEDYTFSMKEFLTQVLPKIGSGKAKFDAFSKVREAERATTLDHNSDELLEVFKSHEAPFVALWNAIERVAKNQPLEGEDRDALRGGVRLIGAVIAERKGAIEDMRAKHTDPAQIDDAARLIATVDAAVKAKLAGKTRPPRDAVRITGNDYKRAANNAMALREDISHWDNSPEVLGALQADLVAMNKALGISGTKRV